MIKEFKRTILDLKRSIDFEPLYQPTYPLVAEARDADGVLILSRTFYWTRRWWEICADTWKFPVTVTVEDQEGMQMTEVLTQSAQLNFNEVFAKSTVIAATGFELVRQALRSKAHRR